MAKICVCGPWGSLQRSPDPLLGLKGPTFKGGADKGKGRGVKGKREYLIFTGGDRRP